MSDQLHLQPEGVLLHLARHVFIVIVQPDLADCLHAGAFAERTVHLDARRVHNKENSPTEAVF